MASAHQYVPHAVLRELLQQILQQAFSHMLIQAQVLNSEKAGENMKVLQKLLRALVRFFSMRLNKPRAYFINRLPAGFELSENEKAAMYGKECAP